MERRKEITERLARMRKSINDGQQEVLDTIKKQKEELVERQKECQTLKSRQSFVPKEI